MPRKGIRVSKDYVVARKASLYLRRLRYVSKDEFVSQKIILCLKNEFVSRRLLYVERRICVSKDYVMPLAMNLCQNTMMFLTFIC